MKSLKVAAFIILILLIIIGGFILKTLRDAGEFKTIVPNKMDACHVITGVQSSEDITIHPQTGMAFISSDDRRPSFDGMRGKQGAVFGFDLSAKDPTLVNLTRDLALEFHPHGIGLLVGKGGVDSLFVVNHRSDGHFVEIFDIADGKLIHRTSVSGELMHSPNDVIPVGPNAFYVTNDHGNTTRFGRTLEDYLQLARSYVLYYDGDRFRKVAGELAYANGINISHDGKTVYVAATVGGNIYLYHRDAESGSLTLRQVIDLGTGVDNIELDSRGDLWVGAHPRLLTFVQYAKDPNTRSPSQVLLIRLGEAGQHRVEEIYVDEGEPLSGSSVAACFNNTLLVGSVFDDRFLSCHLPVREKGRGS
ncbi:MAG: strictosidine synthase family protein [Deltaproteobacteria bacterium]|nr:strictosidine synthase family protein [Deltaproteobacteria bacterium]